MRACAARAPQLRTRHVSSGTFLTEDAHVARPGLEHMIGHRQQAEHDEQMRVRVDVCGPRALAYTDPTMWSARLSHTFRFCTSPNLASSWRWSNRCQESVPDCRVSIELTYKKKSRIAGVQPAVQVSASAPRIAASSCSATGGAPHLENVLIEVLRARPHTVSVSGRPPYACQAPSSQGGCTRHLADLSAAAHLKVLLALARVDVRRHAVRARRHRQRRVDVHVLHQDRRADGRPVVQPRAAVAMSARSAHSRQQSAETAPGVCPGKAGVPGAGCGAHPILK